MSLMTHHHARLAGLGFATPRAIAQEELALTQRKALGLEGVSAELFARIVSASGIDSRGVVADVSTILDRTTAERMRLFAELAPPIAVAAACEALAKSDIPPDAITDVVIATCTGLAAPGLASDLAERLPLSCDVRPLQLGFMGCFGGIAALRTARALACADPSAVVLVVAIELCSLHFRRGTAPDALVSFAIFGDGASAAIVLGDDARGRAIGSLVAPRTRNLGGRELMGWNVEDDGFRMTLGRAVPEEIERCVPDFLGPGRPSAIALHPGGVAIIDAVGRALGATIGTAPSGERTALPAANFTNELGLDLAESRRILRTTGNTSSGAVFRVANQVVSRNRERVRGETPSPQRSIDLVAFGPGLIADAIRLEGD